MEKENQIKPVAKKRVGRLDTLKRARAEMGRLYRESRRGELDSLSALRMSQILEKIIDSLEFEAIEQLERELNDIADRAPVLSIVEKQNEGQEATGTIIRAN